MQSCATSSSSPWVLSIAHDLRDFSDLAWMLDPKWSLRNAVTLRSGLEMLAKARVAVVLCECDLRPGMWKDVLEYAVNCRQPPHVIVTSRSADERLWAEILNLGGYDALAKPFDATEVRRTVGAAWLNWIRKYEPTQLRERSHYSA